MSKPSPSRQETAREETRASPRASARVARAGACVRQGSALAPTCIKNHIAPTADHANRDGRRRYGKDRCSGDNSSEAPQTASAFELLHGGIGMEGRPEERTICFYIFTRV